MGNCINNRVHNKVALADWAWWRWLCFGGTNCCLLVRERQIPTKRPLVLLGALLIERKFCGGLACTRTSSAIDVCSHNLNAKQSMRIHSDFLNFWTLEKPCRYFKILRCPLACSIRELCILQAMRTKCANILEKTRTRYLLVCPVVHHVDFCSLKNCVLIKNAQVHLSVRFLSHVNNQTGSHFPPTPPHNSSNNSNQQQQKQYDQQQWRRTRKRHNNN